jgi:glutamine amidotransferase
VCRFVAYLGPPAYLDELVCASERSLVHQSRFAEEAKVSTNGDGFGIGWYGERPQPALYREVTPAWSDENLLSLARTVRSSLFFAHVRAATGTPTARANCHPFAFGKYLFMHNGQIGGYAQLKRRLESRLPDAHYAARAGVTDSELLFLLTLAQIEQGASVPEAVAAVFAQTRALMRAAGISAPLRFAAALADGQAVYAFRLSSDAKPPTLYTQRRGAAVVIASEPLDEDASWQPVAPGSVVTAQADGLSVELLVAPAHA